MSFRGQAPVHAVPSPAARESHAHVSKDKTWMSVLGTKSYRLAPGSLVKALHVIHLVVTMLLVVMCSRLTSKLAEQNGTAVEEVDGDGGVQRTLQLRLERKHQELETARHLIRVKDREIAKFKEKKIEKSSKSDNDDTLHEIHKLRKRDSAMMKNIVKQQDSISRLSTDLLSLKFPRSTPHQVEITVGFPASMGAPSEGKIIAEMAPTRLMPTAVLYFLNQVDAGLWNGCAFIRNAHHVLQASAQSVAKKSLHDRFRNFPKQTMSIPFQEYSEHFEHKKYTLGLAGRPGGPDFYISTVDNTRNHGPGGQGSYNLPEEADSCFAKVVSGFDVVDRMHTAKREKDSFQGLVEYIEIISIRLV